MNSHSQSGFALIISLIVATVVIMIGISILELTTKQVQLTAVAKDSEIAFHAANAGMECARFIRTNLAEEVESGATISPSCFGSSVAGVAPTIISVEPDSVPDDGDVFQYEYELAWGSGADVRCTRVNMFVASTSPTGDGVVVSDMNIYILGYPEDEPNGSGTYTTQCAPGSRCTVISVQGYNRTCLQTDGYGVLQREVLLQF